MHDRTRALIGLIADRHEALNTNGSQRGLPLGIAMHVQQKVTQFSLDLRPQIGIDHHRWNAEQR